MRFLAPLSLLLLLFISGPIVAHLLRSGRARSVEFAATRFIPVLTYLAHERRRISDRGLLVVRSIILFTLALLGATPIMRCDRKLLDRSDGASVARILVLDDSGSMQARAGTGKSRFDLAKSTALSLVDQMQQGDSVGVVLASKPARIKLFPSAERATVRAELQSLQGSDRATDLASALALANGVLARQPQADKKLLLLSDLAEPNLPQTANTIVVLPELARPIRDCGLIKGTLDREQLVGDFACHVTFAQKPLHVELVDSTDQKRVLASTTFVPESRGHFVFGADYSREVLQRGRYLRLVESDDNPANDVAPIVSEKYQLEIGVYADLSSGRAQTYGRPLTEQALAALNPGWRIQPLSTVPDDPSRLTSLSILILDDPPPLIAEARSAIDGFVRRGNLAIALFGPASSTAQLSNVHLPFLEQRAEWQPETAQGLLPFSADSPIRVENSLQSLGAKGRFVFDESYDPKVRILARWSDQVPFLMERAHGRGSLVVLGLPSSTKISDLALRPGFLAILDSLIAHTERRGKARVVTVGTSWLFPSNEPVAVRGPSAQAVTVDAVAGPLLHSLPGAQSPAAEQRVTPERVGLYELTRGTDREERLALFPPEEILTAPQVLPVIATDKPNQTTGHLDLTRYLVLVVLSLLGLELLLRLLQPEWLFPRLKRWKIGAKPLPR